MARRNTNSVKLPALLLISSGDTKHTIDINDSFVDALGKRLEGICTIEWQNYHNIGLEIAPRRIDAFLVSNMRPLSAFKAVYFKSYFRYHEQATAIAEALEAHGIFFVGNELRQYIPAYKLSQMARLSRAGLPLPRTLYLPQEHYVSNFPYIVANYGLPFIFKAVDGATGDDNYLVGSEAQLKQLVRQYPERHFIVQNFIQNDGDLRILIVGGEIRLIIERRRSSGATHLNNTSKGAAARLIPIEEFDQSLQKLSLAAGKIMGRDVAGVDLMLEADTGNPYILEVNASPQIGSGAFEEEKLAIYADFFTGMAKR